MVEPLNIVAPPSPLRRIGHFPGLQIVPTIDAHHELLTHPALGAGAATLNYHGGKLITQGRGKLFNIYLGVESFDLPDFTEFSRAIVEDGYYLSPDGLDSAPGQFIGATSLPYPFGGSIVPDSTIASFVNS